MLVAGSWSCILLGLLPVGGCCVDILSFRTSFLELSILVVTFITLVCTEITCFSLCVKLEDVYVP